MGISGVKAFLKPIRKQFSTTNREQGSKISFLKDAFRHQ